MTIHSSKDQIIEGYQEPDELHYRNDGYVSKTYDPAMYMKTRLEQGATIITVSHAVWMGLPDHERILWERLGDIKRVKGTSPKLIERVLPEAQKAMEGAKVEIGLAEEMDLITFYSKALGLLLCARRTFGTKSRYGSPIGKGQDKGGTHFHTLISVCQLLIGMIRCGKLKDSTRAYPKL